MGEYFLQLWNWLNLNCAPLCKGLNIIKLSEDSNPVTPETTKLLQLTNRCQMQNVLFISKRPDQNVFLSRLLMFSYLFILCAKTQQQDFASRIRTRVDWLRSPNAASELCRLSPQSLIMSMRSVSGWCPSSAQNWWAILISCLSLSDSNFKQPFSLLQWAEEMKEDESNNGLVSNLDSDRMKSFGIMLYLLFSDYLCPNALLIKAY